MKRFMMDNLDTWISMRENWLMTYLGIYFFSSKKSCRKSKEREDVSWKRKFVSEKQEMAEENQKKKETLKVRRKICFRWSVLMEKRDIAETRDGLGKTNGRWRDGVYRKEGKSIWGSME
jgi:hypothetical protein